MLPSQAKPSQAKPSQAKPSQAKPSQAKKLAPLAVALLAGLTAYAPLFSHAAEPQSPADTAPLPAPLPDLGKPTADKSALNVNAGPGGLSFQAASATQKFSLTPEYSNQTGLSVGAGFATLLGDNAALGLLVNLGAEKQEWLINAGYAIDSRQRIILTGGQLTQKIDYRFLSGTEKVGLTQNSGGLSYQLQLGETLLRSLDLNAYVSKTASKDLTDKNYTVDTAALYELWSDPRRIAGGTVTGVQGRLGLSPITGSLIKLSLGAEELKYDVLIGKDTTTRATGGIEWLQQLPDRYNLKVAADSFASQNRYTIGLDRSLPGADGGRHTLGLAYTGVQGRDGLGNDSQIRMNYSYSFGTGSRSNGTGGSTAAPLDAARIRPANPVSVAPGMAAGDPAAGLSGGNSSNLLDQVAMRPNYLPSHVVAKVDKTALPTRLIAIDKTSLAGSTIDAATGDITTPLGVAVTGIASVTRNGGAFTNNTQFALSGNNLITRPSQIIQPAAGVTDTYVVTINNSGGGTTLATILVTKGSVKIDSIVISSGVVALPAGYLSQGGLTWTPNTIGGWNGGGYTDWNTANTYCTTSTINGQTGWRLPTTAELSALYTSGAMNGQPGWALDYTWSSTPHGAGRHESVYLNGGGVSWDVDWGIDYVSCVR